MLSLSDLTFSSENIHRCAGFQKGERVKGQKLKPPHTTEPKEVVVEVRVEAVAIGAPRAEGAEAKKAAAQNTDAPCGRACRISSCWLTIRRPIPIPTPLKQI